MQLLQNIADQLFVPAFGFAKLLVKYNLFNLIQKLLNNM